jgi:hypothetical protein
VVFFIFLKNIGFYIILGVNIIPACAGMRGLLFDLFNNVLTKGCVIANPSAKQSFPHSNSFPYADGPPAHP